MTYNRLRNKWCNKCPNNDFARNNLSQELMNQIHQNNELRIRLRLALEKIDELAEQVRRADALLEDVDN